MAACVAWWDISSFSHTPPKSRRCAAVQQLSCVFFVCLCSAALSWIHTLSGTGHCYNDEQWGKWQCVDNECICGKTSSLIEKEVAGCGSMCRLVGYIKFFPHATKITKMCSCATVVLWFFFVCLCSAALSWLHTLSGHGNCYNDEQWGKWQCVDSECICGKTSSLIEKEVAGCGSMCRLVGYIKSFPHATKITKMCSCATAVLCFFLFVCAVLRSLGYIHCQALATATTTSSGVNGSVSTTSAFAAKHLH